MVSFGVVYIAAVNFCIPNIYVRSGFDAMQADILSADNDGFIFFCSPFWNCIY